METKQTKLEKSQIEVEFTLSKEEFDHFLGHALEHLKSHVKVDGFRQGQAPAKLVEDKIKPEMLLMEAGDIAVSESYSKYVKENNLEPMGQPEVTIVKIAKGSEFVFKAKITVLPEVDLPDYKEIASKVKGQDVSVSEDEVQDALKYLQKTRAKFTAKNEPAEKKDFVEIEYENKDINEGKPAKDQFILGEGGFMPGFEDSIVGMKSGDEKSFKTKFPQNSVRQDLAGKEGDFKVKVNSVQKMELPEIGDDFAKSLGAFDSLDALKTSIKEGVTAEKKEAEKQRRRTEMLDKIAAASKFEVPEAMVEYEQQRLFEDLKNRISQTMNIPFEQYLAAVKQTEEQIRETYKKEAEKRLKEFLVLREIGKRENIQVSEEEAEQEVAKSVKNYSKEQISKIDISQLKEYTKGVILNEKIFQILENLSS